MLKPLMPFKIIIDRINHKFAKKNIDNNPQLAIFAFDHIGLSINLDGRYEDSLLKLIEEFICKEIPDAEKCSAVDVGANIGNHSVFFSKFFNRVHSFEPNPLAFDVLKVNAKYAIPKNNIEPYPIGLSDIDGYHSFSINRCNMGASKIESDEIKLSSCQNIRVKVQKADNIQCLQNEKISLVKIDVEGHEVNVLKGARNIIQHNKPAIIFEQGAAEIVNGSSRTIDYLAGLGYEFYTIRKRFYFGENFFGKLSTIILSSIFGFQLSLVATTFFKKKFQPMILALPIQK